MDANEIRRRKREVVERHGPWTAHNIHLGAGIYTIDGPSAGGSESRLRRAVQIVADLSGRAFSELRVADLGCLEGEFAVEFASRGAAVVAVEGRKANIEKAGLAKAALALERLELVEDDVRNFSWERYGRFDVVLAIGIVYHLDVPEVFDFLASIAEACDRLAIIDTEVAMGDPGEEYVHDGVTYRGFRYDEPTGGPHDRDVLWSAVGNRRSFAFTRGSLCNALLGAGFTTALECHLPPVLEVRPERATFVATKGSPQSFVTSPPLNQVPLGEVPEFTLSLLSPPPRPDRSVRGRISRLLRRLPGRRA